MNNKGFSLIQVLVFLGISAAINVAVVQMIANQSKSQSYIHYKNSALAIRQNIIGLISNHHSWTQTRSRQTFMRCLGGRSSNDFCFSSSPTGPKKEIQLYTATGVLFHDNKPTSGYNVNGEPCDDFGSPQCPFKFHVNWRTQCTSTTCTSSDFSAPEMITIDVEFASESSTKGIHLNPQNYGLVEQNRLVFSDQSSPALNCASRSKIFIGISNAFNSFSADPQGCVDLAAFYGPQGPPGPQGPQGPRGPAGPSRTCPACP